MIESEGHAIESARSDIPVGLVSGEYLRLVVGFPERRGVVLVVHLPERGLGIAKPECCAVIQNSRQQWDLETDLVLGFFPFQVLPDFSACSLALSDAWAWLSVGL